MSNAKSKIELPVITPQLREIFVRGANLEGPAAAELLIAEFDAAVDAANPPF
jgi:hypothetical protein